MTTGDGWDQMCQLGSSDALNKLEPIFSGLQLKTSIQQVLDAYDKTKVVLLVYHWILKAVKIRS